MCSGFSFPHVRQSKAPINFSFKKTANKLAQLDRVKRRVVSCTSSGAVGWLQSLDHSRPILILRISRTARRQSRQVTTSAPCAKLICCSASPLSYASNAIPQMLNSDNIGFVACKTFCSNKSLDFDGEPCGGAGASIVEKTHRALSWSVPACSQPFAVQYRHEIGI
jgi:hypothetical protein